MKVLVLTNFYPPHDFGGYEMSCRDVVERWQAAGHEVTVLTSTTVVQGSLPQAGEAEGRVRRSLRLYWDDHRVQSPPLRGRLALELHNQRSLRRALRDVQPDVVSVWGMGMMSMGLLGTLAERRVPAVLVICDEWPVYGIETDAWLRPLTRLAEARDAAQGTATGAARGRRRIADALWLAAAGAAHALGCSPASLPPLDSLGPAYFVSDALRRRVREQSPWHFPDSSVVHSGVDLDLFKPDPAGRPPESGKDAWGWRALFAGRIDSRKGIDTVLRAVALLDERATLQVLGRGDSAHLAELVALAHELGIEDRVSFGQASREDLASSYRQADVVLFASIWEEPFGLVPLEAMACGTPVVATATGGAAEYLVDGANCLVCPAGDATKMADLVNRLASDPAIRARIVAGGKATARELGVDKLADLLLAQHEAAASGAGTADPGKSGNAPVEPQIRRAPVERQERQSPPLP